MKPHPKSICYMVIATLPSQKVASDYIAWLENGHVDHVVKAGAHAAMIVVLEPEAHAQSPRVMTQYIFSTRESFDHYVTHHAPALRADGQKHFGPDKGVTMQRLLGEVL